jgi:hypothetical protein
MLIEKLNQLVEDVFSAWLETSSSQAGGRYEKAIADWDDPKRRHAHCDRVRNFSDSLGDLSDADIDYLLFGPVGV